MKKEISNRITVMSFVMSVLVVMIHSYNLNSGKIYWGGVTWIEDYISKGLGGIANPGFFMLSGYLFYRSFYDSEIQFHEIIRKQKKRIKTLAVPYIIWNTFGTVFYMIIPAILNEVFGTALEFPKATAANILAGILNHKYYFPLWWLKTMICFVVFAPVLGTVLKKKWAACFVIIVCAVLGTRYYSICGVGIRWLAIYLLGAYMGVYHRGVVERNYSRVFSGAAWLYIMIISGIRIAGISTVANDILLILSPAALWIALSGMNVCPTQFMKHSFFVYTSHILIVSSISNILEKISYSQIWVVMNYFLTAGISMIIIYIGYRILNDNFKAFYRIISGNR